MWSCAMRSFCTVKTVRRTVVLASGCIHKRCNSTLVVCDTPLEKVDGTKTTSSLSPDVATRSVLSAAQELKIPNVHLLVVGPQAPNVVPVMVTKIRHLTQDKGRTDEEKVYEVIEDSIADDTCTHVLMAAKPGGETSPVLTEASKRFVGALVPDVVAIKSRDTFLVGSEKTRKQHKDMLKLLSIQTDAFPAAPLPTESEADAKEPVIDVVQPPSASSRLAFKVLPVVTVGLVLLCCL